MSKGSDKVDRPQEPEPAGPTSQAALSGPGAIAQGPGAIAVGANAVYAGRDIIFQARKPDVSVPFQAPSPAADHVPRPRELAHLQQYLLGDDGELLPNTVGLHGFGGAGKTTLARLLCADEAVRRACREGILWVPVGKRPAEPRAQIADLVIALTGECNGCVTLPGARAQLQAALSGRKVLLVLDDVWDEAQVKDLVEASTGCARLITTRHAFVLPVEAKLVDVTTMYEADARHLLGVGLPAGQDVRLLALVRQLGCWPVLLRLANRVLRQRIQRQNMSPAKALDAVERDLARKGVLAFDPAHDALERDQAVAATVEASLEMLDPAERQRYAELAVFPQDVPLPLAQAAQVWQLTAGLDSDQAEDLVASRLEPLSLLDYDGESGQLRLHDVLRSYLAATLAGKAALHQRLAARWGDRPAASDEYAWRWLAFHRAQAAMANEQPVRHALTESLVALVTDEGWQQSHERAVQDLPALREALSDALDAAVADDVPLGVPLVVQAADALVRFRRERLRAEPIFELARQGEVADARRRSELFALDDHWRQALLLFVAWLAPRAKRHDAQELCTQMQAELGPEPALVSLLQWVRAGLWEGAPAPVFPVPALAAKLDEALVEELLKRVGGGAYNRELIVSRGLDPDVRNPDMPPPPPSPQLTRGIHVGSPPMGADEQTTTRYLAELDGPCLVAYAAADPTKGMDALARYLSVYTNYNYPEYRFSTLWLLLGSVVAFPRPDGAAWVQEAVGRILASALGGGSVEFEQGLAIAATALRARAQDQNARQRLEEQAQRLMQDAARLKPGRDREGSDMWAHHKRLLMAHAQALGWLLGNTGLAAQALHDAEDLADSGFAGYQAPACLALAETIAICQAGGTGSAREIEQALEWAQQAAHNVQDPTFCARMTARVNAMRRHWWPGFDLDERARRLADAGHLPEFAALHRVGHRYAGRRPDALRFPDWARVDLSFDALQRLYQRPKADFLRLNDRDRPLAPGDEIAVPDPGFVPHLAARLAAEVLAHAGHGPTPSARLQLLRSLVAHAVPSPTALDAVLSRLVLAQARCETPPDPAEATALEAVLARRPPTADLGAGSELLASPSHARLPASAGMPSQGASTMVRKKLFLASSSELKDDRTEFEIFVNRKNKDWVSKGVFLELVVWEDFLDAVSQTRLQDEYNKAIRECDLFVMLFFTKVGPYTEEEFETAFKQFKATAKPFIFTYFKDAPVSLGSVNERDLTSLLAFKKKLATLGHYLTIYKNVDELKYKFDQQLDKLTATGFIELRWDKDETAASAPTHQATLTGSGAIAQGSRSIAVGAGGIAVGRDYVGGDRFTTGDVSGAGIAIGREAQASGTQGIAPRELESLFAPILTVVAQQAPPDRRVEAMQKVQELKSEVAKGKQGDDGKIARTVDGLVGLVPEAMQAVVSAFATPILGGIAGPVTKYVLEKLTVSG